MKSLLKLVFILAACFALTFILVKSTGVLTVDQIKMWLEIAKSASPVYLGLIVIALLFMDLFIAVPTLTVIILSGYFLGHWAGAIASLTGLLAAGLCGYAISSRWGVPVLKYLLKNENQQQEAIENFNRHGFIMILLSRAIPILPEVTACLAGSTRMPFSKFMTAWLISAVPYVLIASYGGSISSLTNPRPAILTAILISGGLWLAWFIYRRRWRRVQI